MTDPLRNYQYRMLRVLDHIDAHLEEPLDVERLAGVAAFSKYHFHRQFSATFGLPVQRYWQLARMKRASYRLAFREGERVTDVALDAGYEAPDAFARAFRKRLGQSPSEFRTDPQWASWLAAFGPLDDARRQLMQSEFTMDDVTVQDVPAIPVAIMEHRGDPRLLGATIQRFIAWRRAAGLPPKVSATFNIFRSEPMPDPIDAFHVDLCVGIDRPGQAAGEGVIAGEIPAGRRAVLRQVGQSDRLEEAALFLYRDWLPASGEEADDFPLYCQRLSFFPDVPEHEAVVDLLLPLKAR